MIMENTVKIRILQGILEGSVKQDLNGDVFYQILGIPYGKPPVGDLRFKEPLPAEPWDGIRDATKECPNGYCKDEMSGIVGGSEDCLFLNVYTKSLPGENRGPKPVMVWIPGGAFLHATISPRLYGPEFLMTEDIVLVTVQYRVGILGFLRLKDPSLNIPGNAGLKDQTLALKWVNKNIQHFGGDPQNITIFGNSAGATSVHYHILSPLSRGLFHKAIIQSGAAVKGWDECEHNPVEVAQGFNKEITTETEALNLFKILPVDVLYKVQMKYVLEKSIGNINKQFGPVIENYANQNAFIIKNPLEIIRSKQYNDVPLMVGNNTKEGLLFEVNKKLDPSRIITAADAIPHYLRLERGSDERKQLETKIKHFYFKDGEEEDNLIDVLGDVAYTTPGYVVAVNHALTSKHPVFLYRCSLDTPINYLKHKYGLSHKQGTCHFDEVSYIFNNHRTDLRANTIEKRAIRRMVGLWTSFAKFGHPIGEVTWKPFSIEEQNFLDIGNDGLVPGIHPDRERIEFWTEIYRKYDATKEFL